MRKHTLMAGIAAAALAFGYGAASAQETTSTDGGSEFEVEIKYENELETEIDVDIEYDKEVGLFGEVWMFGFIDPNSSAVAVVDAKQLLSGNEVTLIENGYYASFKNTVDGLDINAQGNVGVNAASGNFNMQENVASIAVVNGSSSGFDWHDDELGITTTNNDDDDDDDNGGGGSDQRAWVEASTTSFQSSSGNSYKGGYYSDFKDENTVSVTAIGGDGNIGVNAAAGAFNMQQNLMALAVADTAVLAEASAGVIQTLDWNCAEVMDSTNSVSVGSITGAGNIGVNLAAGVGNMQHNSLTAAVTCDTCGGGSSGGGDGGGG